MTSKINAATAAGGGVITSADASGILEIQTAGVAAVTIDATQNVVFANPVNLPNTFGFKNRFINGRMRFAQWGVSSTVVAGTTVPTASTGYPCVDRWFVYCTGANVTAAQVAGVGAIQNQLQITGAASVTAVGVGQRIEQNNSFDLAGSTCNLSVDLANSLLTTVTWTASYATTTADTFGTIGTPTKTQIATGTFTVNSTITNYNVAIAVPAAATTGIEILFTVGAQTSGTWTLGRIQLEKGSIPTSYDIRDYTRELQLCERYCFRFGGTISGVAYCMMGLTASTSAATCTYQLPNELKSLPVLIVNGAGALTTQSVQSAITVISISGYAKHNVSFTVTGTGAPYTAGQPAFVTMGTNADLQLVAEIP